MRSETAIARPLPQQVAWQDFELGVLYSFDIPVYRPEGWAWTPACTQVLPPWVYQPAKLDTDQWLQGARDLGARYAIFTATHMGGFLQWQSDAYAYGVRQSPWRDGKGDVVLDFVESCRRADVAPGLFLSWRFNAFWGVQNMRVNLGQGGDDARQVAYERAAVAMFTELCSRYGELCEIWFDGGAYGSNPTGPDVLAIVDRYQPQTVFYHSPHRRHHRWVGNEKGVTDYPCWSTMTDLQVANELHHGQRPGWQEQLAHGDPNGALWSPGMCDPPIRNHAWFWRPGEEAKVRPVGEMMEMVYRSVGCNCNLIVGAVVGPEGLVPQPDMECMAGLGRELRRRFGHPLGRVCAHGEMAELTLARPVRAGAVSIMEEIADGHRIRAYRLEAREAGGDWRNLCAGTAVGHRRLERFPPVETDALRLTVTERLGAPRIREFAAYGPEL